MLRGVIVRVLYFGYLVNHLNHIVMTYSFDKCLILFGGGYPMWLNLFKYITDQLCKTKTVLFPPLRNF